MEVAAVPGLGLDERSLADVLRHVEAETGTRARAVTLPSMGRRGSRSLQELADELTEAVGDEEVTLLGHSASCQVVARAAKELNTRALVLVGPTTDPQLEGWGPLLLAWSRTAVHEETWQVPTLLRQYTRTGPVSMLKAMNALRHEPILLDLEGATYPVVVVRGEDDRIARRPWAEACAVRGGAGSGVADVVGAHVVVQTNPHAVGAAVTRAVRQGAERSLAAQQGELTLP